MAGIDEETARVASNSGPVAYDAMEPRIRDPVTIEQAKLRAEALSLDVSSTASLTGCCPWQTNRVSCVLRRRQWRLCSRGTLPYASVGLGALVDRCVVVRAWSVGRR